MLFQIKFYSTSKIFVNVNKPFSKMAGRGLNTHEVYDISPEERRLMEKRRIMRDNLKNEFQKKKTNPFRGGGYIVSD